MLAISLAALLVPLQLQLDVQRMLRQEPDDGRRVHVTVRATRHHVMLLEEMGISSGESAESISWERLCVAPCSIDLHPETLLRIGGFGITPSDPFYLPAGNQIDLAVRAGSSDWNDAGQSLLLGGGVALIVGLSLLPLALISDTAPVGRPLVGGGVGLGVLCAVAGIALMIANSTSIRTESGEAIPAAGL